MAGNGLGDVDPSREFDDDYIVFAEDGTPVTGKHRRETRDLSQGIVDIVNGYLRKHPTWGVAEIIAAC